MTRWMNTFSVQIAVDMDEFNPRAVDHEIDCALSDLRSENHLEYERQLKEKHDA